MNYSDRKLCDRLMATDSVICRGAAKRIQDLCAQLIDAHEERDTVRTDLTDRLADAKAEIERLRGESSKYSDHKPTQQEPKP